MELNKQILFSELQKQLPYLKHEFRVLKLGVFGSYSRNNANEESDIDLYVEFNHPVGLKVVDMVEYLRKLFNRKVDLLTPKGVESIINKKISSRIKSEIEYVEER